MDWVCNKVGELVAMEDKKASARKATLYLDWFKTPLKWHKFLTYIVLPLSIIVSLVALVRWLELSKIIDSGTLALLNWIDIYFAFARIVLAVVALLGCLPSRRKWYGPKCAIALYGISAVYAVICVWVGVSYFAPQTYIIQNLGIAVGSTVTAILTAFYYRKRRALFSPAAPVLDKPTITIPQASSITEPLHQDSDPENSLELLTHLQQEIEQEKIEDAAKNTLNAIELPFVPKTRTAVLPWVFAAVFLAAGIGLGVLAGYYYSETTRLQTEYVRLETNYNEAIRVRNNLRQEVSNLEQEKSQTASELNFWRDFAVIVTEYGEKYHTYGCQYIEGKTFWIYNVEAAIGFGYEPCSVCNPPTR